MTKLSIVVVGWNTSQLLAACLRSIWEQSSTLTQATVETIVVDNASSDDSVMMIRQDFPWVRLLENAENIGFAAANNQALSHCSGDYIWLLNPDTLLRPGAMDSILKYMVEHPEVGAAGSYLLNADSSLQLSCSPAPTLTRELWRLFHLDAIYPYAQYPMHRWQRDVARQVDVVQGASLLTRRTVLDQVGVLDTDYFIYSEEVDLCHRIRRAGWTICWVPQSEVVHYGGQSTQQAAATMFLQLYQSKVLYFRKRQGELAAHLYKLILFVASVTRIALMPLAGLQSSSRRSRHMTLAGNYLRLALSLYKM